MESIKDRDRFSDDDDIEVSMIKLTTGEIIISAVDNDQDNTGGFYLYDPFMIQQIPVFNGTGFNGVSVRLVPIMPFSDSTVYHIPSMSILYMGIPNKEMFEMYNKLVQSDKYQQFVMESEGETYYSSSEKDSENEYPSSEHLTFFKSKNDLEEARKKLEGLI